MCSILSLTKTKERFDDARWAKNTVMQQFKKKTQLGPAKTFKDNFLLLQERYLNPEICL